MAVKLCGEKIQLLLRDRFVVVFVELKQHGGCSANVVFSFPFDSEV
jgi:hypothetical protein